MTNIESTDTQNKESMLIDHALEIWRLKPLVYKIISKLEFKDQNKYVSQYNWFENKATSYLESEGISFVEYETGTIYDIGLPINPLNIEEFNKDDTLYIKQVLQPVIMRYGKIMKTGTVLLQKEVK